ncbi:FAD-binding oxidoreductase [Nocardia otitidiscaviarum]|uniref:FAD-binding oxidoreductase n=2 Tax=Nocardia otitidiscaviarum TaxID=1823 RepID=A0A516NXQ3_9NOCA|nr:FAD-binding and (Fe-S)-binding domain-containing protein [Nocardia otitidiscaviarum]MCP9623694.1 FAD-binding oxidoreductase [Nocardia otitidiscaviarum]QDP83680.1 FAD-binding oxidoreductase [Nocardia otitidiscaviarum]
MDGGSDGARDRSDAPAIDLRALERDLRAAVQGEVRFDSGSRATYSTDASNYRRVPLGVVLPRTPEDAVAAVAVCRAHDAPVLSRGGGTSLAGQCCNTGVVLDWSKFCDRVLTVDPEARTAVVEPGIALDVLNDRLAEYDLMVGPRPSTHVSCTIGGMIGNNSCGSTAQEYGKMADSVRRLEILTYDGTRAWVGATSDARYAELVEHGGKLGEIVRRLRDIGDRYAEDIRARYPDIPRRVSGYNLDALLPERGFHLARLLVGSESTLVTVLRAEIELVPRPGAVALAVLGYPDIVTAADAVPHVLAHEPSALEAIDDRLVNLESTRHLADQAIRQLPDGHGWLMAQFQGDDQDAADRAAQAMMADVCDRTGATAVLLDDPHHQAEVWAAREAGLGATAYPPDGPETHEGWEDAAVPPDRLGDYLRDFEDLLREFGYQSSSLYGHFGHGCVHTRIPFGLRTADGIARYRRFVERAAHLVTDYGGSLSGEHGDGQSRGELLPIMFGDRLIHAFGELEDVFDPRDRMNPGKVVHPRRLDQDLRQGVDYRPWEPDTHFAFPHDDHRFSVAAGRCVGVGKCRGDQSGVMCPSYRVTREEEHSTRGRARLLFEMLNGDVITDGWRSEEVHDALDLCLACKGCRSDCPVDVDMATYKAEFLSHYHHNRIRPMAHYSMGWIPLWARLATGMSGFANAVVQHRTLGQLVKRAGGLAPQRGMPRFADTRFTTTFPGLEQHSSAERGSVLLWPDTFTNNFEPEVARAAVRVLNAAGFTVRIPTRAVCCGLTWISTGQLATAKRVLRRTLRALRPELRASTPVVVLEPSCAAVFRSDLPELLHGDEDARRLAAQTRTLAELLAERAPDWQPPQLDSHTVVQPHCHHHAILGFDPDRELLGRCGLDADVLDAGCCGLAGNFGFERGHYDVSVACAEDKLMPAVRARPPGTLVTADGFSCRTQIRELAPDTAPVHSAQLLARGLDRQHTAGRTGP